MPRIRISNRATLSLGGYMISQLLSPAGSVVAADQKVKNE